MFKDINNDWLLVAIIWFFLGGLGIHRFFKGRIVTGILMLITFAGFGIWWIVDGILIFTGNFKNKEGQSIPFSNSGVPTTEAL